MDHCAPALSDTEIRALLDELYGLRANTTKQLMGYDDKNYLLTDIVTTDNPNVSAADLQHGVTLKLTNPFETGVPDLIEGQIELLARLSASNVPCPRVLPMKRAEMVARKKLSKQNPDLVTCVRLLTFLPGRTLHTVTCTTKLLYELGQLIADYRTGAQGFTHTGFTGSSYVCTWSMPSLEPVAAKADCLPDQSKVDTIRQNCAEYAQRVQPVYKQLNSGVIHSDFNEDNVLVRETADGSFEVCGLLDFGDAHWGPWLLDVSTCVLYMMLEKHDIPPLHVGGHVLAGYANNGHRLTEQELQLAKCCMLGRLSMSLTYGWFCYLKQPTNSEYILKTQAAGWRIMKLLRDTTDETLVHTWTKVAREQYGVEIIQS